MKMIVFFILLLALCSSVKASSGYSSWTEAQDAANKLIGQMTLEEKVNMTTGISSESCTGMTGSIPRLGIPSFCLADGPTGVAGTYNVSQFPSPITLAATWSKDLAAKQGLAIGEEFHDLGVNYMFAPIAGGPLGRSPFGGRFWESSGADEYLTGVFGSQLVKAFQNDAKVIACTKHFIGYEQEKQKSIKSILPQLQKPYSANIDDFTMHQLYLWPFAETARAGTGQVMCAFNQVNGTQQCEDDATLNGLLKQELNFRGNVVSDYGAVYSNELSANNGMDLYMPGDGLFGLTPNYWGSHGSKLEESVKKGKVKESRIDDMVRRILTPVLRFQYDAKFSNFITPKIHNGFVAIDPVVSNDLGSSVQRNHRDIIREVGTSAVTMVKNNANSLPLNKNDLNQRHATIAILGSDAFGSKDGGKSCSAMNDCDDLLHNQGTQTDGLGSGFAYPPYVINPLDAIQSYLKDAPQVKIQSSRAEPLHLGHDSVKDAVEMARTSDMAFIFGNARGKEKEDRSDLKLREDVDDLIKKVASVNKQTIVILHSAMPLILEEWIDHPNVTSVLFAYYPGQESGASLTPILFGDESPSGKLPFVIVKDAKDYPTNAESDQPLELNPQIDFKEGILIDWKWLDAKGIQPRYPFGYGLSYSTFGYDAMTVKKYFCADTETEFYTHEIFEADPNWSEGKSLYDIVLQVNVSVHNIGKVKSAEVAQLYVSFPKDNGMYAPHLLRGFERQEVDAGKTVQVTFNIRRKDISVWDTVAQKWRIPKGEFAFYCGPNGASDWENKASVTFTA